jgi:hypothetical protein
MRASFELNQTSRIEREERIARQIAPNLARMVATADREGASRGALFAALVAELTKEHA